MYFRGLLGSFLVAWLPYLGGFSCLPNKNISEDLARDALGFLEATVLKTFLKDSTIWL